MKNLLTLLIIMLFVLFFTPSDSLSSSGQIATVNGLEVRVLSIKWDMWPSYYKETIPSWGVVIQVRNITEHKITNRLDFQNIKLINEISKEFTDEWSFNLYRNDGNWALNGVEGAPNLQQIRGMEYGATVWKFKEGEELMAAISRSYSIECSCHIWNVELAPGQTLKLRLLFATGDNKNKIKKLDWPGIGLFTLQ